MITLGINEFIMNIRRNILVIVQMIAIYMISIFVISAFQEQYSLYDGMSDVLDDTGAVMTSAFPMHRTDNIVTYDGLMSLLDKVDDIVVTYYYNVFLEDYSHNDITAGLEMQIISNDPKLITYKPKLLDGTWCEDAPYKEGVINIIISNNSPVGFKVGDTISIDNLTFYITGIYDSEELIYGYSGSSKGKETNYLHFYDSVKNAYSNKPIPVPEPFLAVASYEDVEKLINPLKTAFGKVVIDFEDDITEEEYQENLNKIKDYYGHVENQDIYNSKIIYDNTMAHLEMKLLPMFILLAIIFFILIVSMLTASAVNVLYEKKNYGIYFVCGNDWKKTFVISAIHWISVSVISIIIAVSGCLLMKAFGKFEQLTLSFTGTHVWVILGITIVTLIISMILPYNMLRKIQPVSILKENED